MAPGVRPVAVPFCAREARASPRDQHEQPLLARRPSGIRRGLCSRDGRPRVLGWLRRVRVRVQQRRGRGVGVGLSEPPRLLARSAVRVQAGPVAEPAGTRASARGAGEDRGVDLCDRRAGPMVPLASGDAGLSGASVLRRVARVRPHRFVAQGRADRPLHRGPGRDGLRRRGRAADQVVPPRSSRRSGRGPTPGQGVAVAAGNSLAPGRGGAQRLLTHEARRARAASG